MSSSTPPAKSTMPTGGNKSRMSTKTRVSIFVLVVALIVGILSIRGLASFYTDYLWFSSLDFSSIWSGVLLTKIYLSLIFISLFAGLLYLNFYIAEKISPKQRPSGPEEKTLAKYHSSILSKKKWIPKLAVAALLGLMVGAGAGRQWQEWLLFTNSSEFGVKDQLHKIDIGFYVFQLPFLDYVVGWLFKGVIVIILFTAIYHYVLGGIRLNVNSRKRVTPPVHAHLSILLGVLALIRALDYFLGRFELTTSSAGFVDGASYADVNARLPALNLLIVIALLSTALFIYNIWRKNWIIPAITVGLWAFTSIVMGTIYPAIIQRLKVSPAESNVEKVYIARNIESTRIALGLNNVVERTINVDNAKSYAELVEANRDITNVIPIQDPKRLPQTFEQLQGERSYYEFSNPLDVDRYNIDGVITPVVIGSRELNPKDLPTSSWESTSLAFTHGFGAVLTPANSIESGLPNFRIGGVPVENSLQNISLTEPRIYVGEFLNDYSIVNTNRKEIDGNDTSEQGTYTYTGTGGVKMDSFIKRISFALRFANINPLISNFINEESRIIYIRNVRERITKLAPFISLDSEIYPVIADGRIFYIVDGYTTTNRYPYSQRVDTAQLAALSGLRQNFNYIRNSVKVVVDSFDGMVKFYVFDETDPILKTWRKVFPALFFDKAEMSTELLDHIRYPEDLFRIQTNVWASYQLDNPQAFYSRSEAWSVAQDPGSVTEAGFTTVTNARGIATRGQQVRIDPYYTVLRLPQENTRSYVTLRPFVPVSGGDTRKELTAFMVAKGDPQNYGELVLYRTPGGNVDGPAIINSKIQNVPSISRIITLLDQQGSNIRFGDMLLVPIEDSILYVRSLYVEAVSTRVPELQRVIAVLGDSVVMCSTLEESLQALFDPSLVSSVNDSSTENCVGDVATAAKTTTPPSTGTPSTTTTTTTQTDQSLDGQVRSLLKQADDARLRGDLGRYQELVSQALKLLS